MHAIDRHALTKAATIAGLTVTEKSAACTPAQLEVLQEVWPTSAETSKRAALARVLASGMLVEEGEETPAFA